MMKQNYENKVLDKKVLDALVNDGTPAFKQPTDKVKEIDTDKAPLTEEEEKDKEKFFDVEIKTTK